MKRVTSVFLLAVLLPSLGLAALAIRSLQDTETVLAHQQTLLYQGFADSLSREVNDLLYEVQRSFRLEVEHLLLSHPDEDLARSFNERLHQRWPWTSIGFAVSDIGEILSPAPSELAEIERFYADNGLFLSNQESVEAYVNPGRAGFGPRRERPATAIPAPTPSAEETEDPDSLSRQHTPPAQSQTPPQPPTLGLLKRQLVLPETNGDDSRIRVSKTEFLPLTHDASEGTIARFLHNKLHLSLWYRSPRTPEFVFGVLLNLDRLTIDLEQALKEQLPEDARSENVCVAVLNDKTSPVALSVGNHSTDWKRPLVASEIGEVLPHWEVAVYLINPNRLNESARKLQYTFGLLIVLLVLAISLGGWLIVRDLRYQLRLARQKTDFVSNVSHELKTPLTSIRMFSELLTEGQVDSEDKRNHYLRIIGSEAARLTRLINNVLDFSRSERGTKEYHMGPCDLGDLIQETLETYRPQLENSGFKVHSQIPPDPLPVQGDRDALAQVLINLLSNAEKYSPETKDITVEVQRRTPTTDHAEVRVLDRGLGVPPGSEELVFQEFHRVHDNLDNGIQGSGLGLTLARSIARAHGGEMTYSPRPGGGSCFRLRIPLDLNL